MVVDGDDSGRDRHHHGVMEDLECALAEVESDLDEESRVYEWRTEQLQRLGFSGALARTFAGMVDWHDIAALVERGCTPALALEIVR
jgi:hypothetical protein